VAVLREGHVVIPQPETVLAAGDEVVALAPPQSESALRTAVCGEATGPPLREDPMSGAGSI
jgi:Trk K+ transport system NAD-binding subunit